MSPPTLWRAPLFMPGDSERKLQKGATLGADAVILDLEDGVAQNRKDQAREVTARALLDLDFGRSARIVRTNAPGSGLEWDDLRATLPGRPDAYLLPKVESAEAVREVSRYLAAAESAAGWPAGQIRLVALLETALGVLQAAAIAASDARLCGLGFGAEDYCASVGAVRTRDGMEVLYARSHVVAAAAAHGLQALDTPYVALQDSAHLAVDAAWARTLGYTGKFAIHPAQVAAIHAAFAPSAAELSAAASLLEAHDAHQAGGTGVFVHEGRMVDMPMVRAAQRVVARAGVTG